jgi:F0F1-type ATP synthase membrane subunit b/b'
MIMVKRLNELLPIITLLIVFVLLLMRILYKIIKSIISWFITDYRFENIKELLKDNEKILKDNEKDNKKIILHLLEIKMLLENK